MRTEEGKVAAAHKLRRDVSPSGLMFVSLGSIIGSGWLFGALYASQIAGPAAIIAWIAGGLVMLLLALVHAELGSMYPVAGGSARYPLFSFGSTVGFAIGWIVWVGTCTVAPIQVLAALQYFSHFFPWFTSTAAGVTILTVPGIVAAVVLMALFTLINMLGVSSLAKFNTAITVWKVAIPVLAVIALMFLSFDASNFTAAGGFAPFGTQGILSAVSTGGIIFAYLGFEQAVQLGGETHNPGRNIPLAIIGAMLIGVAMYIGLQVAFVGALHPAELKNGWAQLSFQEAAGPFAGLAIAVGAGWLATLLYVDAAVSPGGTGLLYSASSSRVLFAMARHRYVPSVFGILSERSVPIVSIIFSFLVGCAVFLPFPGWQQLVGFITAGAAMGYATVPLAFGALRRQEPDHPRPFRLPAGEVLAPIAFIAANLLIYWAGWTVIWKLFVAIALGFALLAVAQATNRSARSLEWRGASWLWPYLTGMAVISYLGAFGGGLGVIPFGWDVVVVSVFSMAIYALAISVRLAPEEVRRHVAEAREEAEEELAV
jgi:amino acid transporter